MFFPKFRLAHIILGGGLLSVRFQFFYICVEIYVKLANIQKEFKKSSKTSEKSKV